MNIIFVTIADLPEGGGNTYYLRMCVRALAHAGHNVTIWNEHALGIAPTDVLVAAGDWEGGRYKYVLGRTARSSGFGSIAEKIRAVGVMSRWLEEAKRKGQVDVLWFNNLSFYDTWWLTRKANQLGVPTIQFYQDERQEIVSKEALSLSRRLFALNSRMGDNLCPPLADAVVVVSNYLRVKYEKLGVDPTKMDMLSTIVECEAWKSPEEEDVDVPVILYAGAFGEQDEIEGLVEAMAVLRDNGHKFKSVLLGDNRRDSGRMARLREQVSRLRLADRVEMPGFVPWDQVRQHIQRANILINIRRDDAWSHSGFSVKLGEYLAAGRMVLASSVGDVGYFLKDGESALLLKPGVRPPEIADALSRAIASTELRRRIGRGGWDVAKRHFDLPVAAQKLDGLLRKVISSRTPASAVAPA